MQTSSTTRSQSEAATLLPNDFEASSTHPPDPKPPFTAPPPRNRLLIGAYAILFIRYCIATFLSSFFTQVATQLGISGAFNGLIFAAYPAGMALTSIVAPQLIQAIGTRAAVFSGLLLTSIFTLAFGLVPDMATYAGNSSGQVMQWLFLVCYFVNGLTGALAETACIIMVSKKFDDKLGVIMASIGTVSGVGCMIGPVVGGVLYDAMPDGESPPPSWAFRLPFMVCGVLPLFMLPPLRLYMPSEFLASSSQAAAPFRSVLSLSVVLGLLSVALSGTTVATLDPTLSYRLSAPPFRLSPSWVSLFFMYSSIVYTIISIPVGWLVDRFPGNSRVFKLTTGVGFVFLALTFALLAPFGFASWGVDASWADGRMEAAMNNMPCTATAMVLKGFGSAFSNNAVYPDLVIGLPEDNTMLQATISGMWNAAYAAGWALGPLVGGVLYEAFQGHNLCLGKDAHPPNCPDTSAPPPVHAPPPPPPGEGPGCSCEWQPANGFDGFGTTITLVCVAYAVVLFAAACANVRGRSALLWTASPVETGGVSPLDARNIVATRNSDAQAAADKRRDG